MPKKLYVSNIPFATTDEDLKDLFESCGIVQDAIIITDRDTHRSKGFGFVTMEEENDALKAISSLDGREISGRTLHVSEARERPNGKSYKKKANKLPKGPCTICGEENILYGIDSEPEKGVCASCISALSGALRSSFKK